jgi:uncharacterized 18.2 kDa protein in rep-hol intergenic region
MESMASAGEYFQGLVKQWAVDRNLIEGSKPEAQCVKLIEEYGELARGIAKKDAVLIKDSIGDTLVVCIILAAQLGSDSFSIDKLIFERSEVNSANVREKLVMNGATELGAISYFINVTNRDIDRCIGNIYALCDTLAEIAYLYKWSLVDCLIAAYNEIKDRKGRCVDGIFIKEGD